MLLNSSKIIHLLISIAILLSISYFFGYKILSGGLLGNDSPNSYSFIVWLDKFFPSIPLLYPLQGSGISFVQGYQVFPLLLVVWLHRLSVLSLIQALELLSFLSVFLSSLGIYLLGWGRFKSQTVGLIGGIFFLLAPVTWVWTTQAGFFPAAFSLIFFAPAFFFVDWYFDFVLNENDNKHKKTIFVSAIFFLTLSLLAHFTTFMALLISSVCYYGIYALIKDRNVFRNIVSVFKAGVSVYGFSILISSFWFISFYTYNSFANWDGSNNPNPLLFPKIDINAFLSIPAEIFKVGSVWTFSFPVYVWILSLLAIIISFFYSRRMLAFSIFMAFALYASVSINFYLFVSKYFPFLASGFSPRIFWIIYNLLAPLLAAWTLFSIFFLVTKNFKKVKIIYPIISVLTILVSVYLIVVFRSVDKGNAFSYAHYGPIYTYPYLYRSYDAGQIYGAGLDLRDIWGRKITEDLAYVTLIDSRSVVDSLQLSNNDEALTHYTRKAVLDKGDKLYLDREFYVYNIPDSLKNHTWITTSNDYKNFGENAFLNFNISRDTDIYVAYDSRAREIPTWLKSDFKETPEVISVRKGNLVFELKVYVKQYPAGLVSLPGNKASGAKGSCHTVVMPEEKAMSGFVDTCCYYQADRETTNKCEKSGAVSTLPDFIEQLKLKNWPKFNLANEDMSKPTDDLTNIFSNFPENKDIRVDFSPNSYGGLLARFNSYRQDVGLINSYTFQLPLNHVFWANAQGIFYADKGMGLYSDPAVMNEEAKYFGVSNILLGGTDPLEKYRTAGWEVKEVGKSFLAKPNFESNIYEIDDKPSVLLIGQRKYNSFEAFYNTAIRGAIPFDKAYVVMGNESVDSYSLSELKKFEVLVLHSYTYRSKDKAWNLLKQYVEQGGSLFVDTGWQYTVPDWNMSNTPEILPIENLEWLNLSTNGTYTNPLFSPLLWNGGPWAVSSSKNLRPGAKPVLEYDGYPLVVEGEFGQGKIVWSGMNVISHALGNDDKDEVEFIGALFNYLIPQNTVSKVESLISHEDPDKFEITLNQNLSSGSNLFFKYAYSPNWKATLISGNSKKRLQTYRGGAGMMYVNLPAVSLGDRVVLEFKLTPIQQVGYLISFLTVLGLIFTKKFDFLGDNFNKIIEKQSKKIRVQWSDDEGYS